MFKASQGDGSRGFARLGLAEAQAGLGVPVAILAAPDSEPSIGTQSEAVPSTPRRTPVVVEVRLVYPRSDGKSLDLLSYRLDRGDSVARLSWQALITYRLAAAGSSGVPWGADPPPEHMIAQLDVNSPPEATGLYPVTVDGIETHWYGIEAPDFVTGEPSMACGGIVDDTIMVAAGPRCFIDSLAVTSWPAPASELTSS